MITPRPLPVLIRTPKHERLERSRFVTIAAGLMCSDGIIVCADTELTHGDSKYQKTKLFAFEESLVLTGAAGDTALICRASVENGESVRPLR